VHAGQGVGGGDLLQILFELVAALADGVERAAQQPELVVALRFQHRQAGGAAVDGDHVVAQAVQWPDQAGGNEPAQQRGKRGDQCDRRQHPQSHMGQRRKSALQRPRDRHRPVHAAQALVDQQRRFAAIKHVVAPAVGRG